MAEDEGTSDVQKGKVVKVLSFDEGGSPVGSEGDSTQQLPVDEFRYSHGIQEPPFSLEKLIYLSEAHPIHGAALEQKTADVVSTGWDWDKKKDSAQDAQKDALEEWLMGLAGDDSDESFHEILTSAWNDYETCGHGCIEIAREPSGKVKRVFHVPAHTTRFHRDGKRVIQMRSGRRVWFKRWIPGDDTQVNRETGAIAEKGGIPKTKRANEILVFRTTSQRSSWYGIPNYITAVGWIALSLAARDDNVLYFQNRREPRWAIILTNLEDDPDIEDDIAQAFAVDLKQPHRNIIVPISGPGKIDFKQLSDMKGDMSFERLQARADSAILVAHRIPGERLGAIMTGPLGGNAVLGASRVYKEALVQPKQALCESRMNRFIAAEGPVKEPTWEWKLNELDLTEEASDVQNANALFAGGVIMLDEARKKAGFPPLPETDKRGKMFITELANATLPDEGLPEGAPPAEEEAATNGTGPEGEGSLDERIDQLLSSGEGAGSV